MKKISLLILILFISHCGYTPIYNKENQTKIKINILDTQGDKKINNLLISDIKKISRNDKGFIIVQSDMPFIKISDINKIYNSIKLKNYLVHVLKFKNKIGNPIGFDISLTKKFKNIKGKVKKTVKKYLAHVI